MVKYATTAILLKLQRHTQSDSTHNGVINTLV